MRASFGNAAVVATEIQGQFRQGADKNVGPSKFGIVAKALWPHKTAAHVAAIAGRDERTASRWLSGEFEPPGIVLTAILYEMTKPR
jgi:hypothetical protein